MSDILKDEYEPEIIDLEDEEGNIKSFEFIDNLEHNGVAYYALAPYSEDDENSEDSDDDIFVILKEQPADNEDEIVLVTIDNQEESDAVGELFIKRFEEAFED